MLSSEEGVYEEVEEEKGGRRRKERERERELGQFVAWEDSLSDWLSGKCGVLDFLLVNQGFERHRLTTSYSVIEIMARKLWLHLVRLS